MRDFYARGCFNGFKYLINLPDVFLGLQMRLGQELKKVIKRLQKGTKPYTVWRKGVQKALFSKNHSEAQGSWEKVYNSKIHPRHFDYYDRRTEKIHGWLIWTTVCYSGRILWIMCRTQYSTSYIRIRLLNIREAMLD